MPENYKPAGSNVTYVVPSLDDPADGPQAFRDFADTIPKDLSPAITVENKAADYTLALVDQGALIAFDCTAKNLTVTIPAEATVAFPVGSVVVVSCLGSNRKATLNVAAAAGVTLKDLSVRSVSWPHMVPLLKIDSNLWIINAGSGTT